MSHWVRKVHKSCWSGSALSACGIRGGAVTDDLAKVTCKLCKKQWDPIVRARMDEFASTDDPDLDRAEWFIEKREELFGPAEQETPL